MSGFPNPEGNRQNPRLKTKSVCIFTWFIYVLTRSVSAFSGKKTSRLLHPIGSLIFADFCTLGFLQHKRIWISFKFLSYFLFPLFFLHEIHEVFLPGFVYVTKQLFLVFYFTFM